MWLVTTRGFFSVVKKDGDPFDLLTVRARTKADLEALAEYLPEGTEIDTETGGDYPARIKITRAEWAKIVVLLTLDVDYHNFKDEVKDEQGSARASIYSQVWGVLLKITPKSEKTQWGFSNGGVLFDDEEQLALKLASEGRTYADIARIVTRECNHGRVSKSMISSFFKRKGGKTAAVKAYKEPQLPKGGN